MKKGLNILVGLVELLIIVYAVFVIVIMLSFNDKGYTEFRGKTYVAVDDTNIAELKNYQVDDLVAVNNLNYNDINVGDSIFYYATYDKHYIVIEDTVTNKDGSNREAVYNFENNKSLVTSEQIIGKLDKVYTGKAKIYNLLTSRYGFLLLVILPVLLIFIYQIYKFVLLLKEDKEMTKQEASPIKLKPREKE